MRDTMRKIELPDLVELLRKSAGEDEFADLDGDIRETPFLELGYDSLALLQLIAEIQRQYGVELDDDILVAETPGEFLGLVNARIEEVAPIPA
jgi:act minimal PKS acyl carrier protein